METRLENNLQCLEYIENYLKANPELRFMQALLNLGLCEDRYNEEPSITYKKLLKNG